MERHKCKLCTRSFSSGRALGGHMKGHLAAHPLPHKTTTLHQLSDSTGEELETKGKSKRKSQSPEVTEEKYLGYGLRNKPKKSFRFSDPEFSFAVDSGSVVVVVVQDKESETESRNSTRKRSNRNRKLFDHHHHQKSLEIKKPKLKKPSCCSLSDTSLEEEVAMCLMMLSRDVWMRNNEGEEEEEVEDQRDNIEMVEESEEIKLIRQKCKKVFGEATETKNAGKVNTETKKIFECTYCYKVFGSGQALGGHKKSHLSTNSSTAVVSHSVKFENNLIDLNLPAPLEDDDFSVVSFAS